ncbi:MAG: hypothetical protein K2P93_00800 [Alphaproteobacteria bacterium]|nr:hypothetical protein [Alphaproteobacteria bacterium]
MATKEAYLSELEAQMEKYKNKISKIDELVSNYKSSNKKQLMAERDSLKEKFQEGENTLKKIKSSSEDNYEKIKEASLETFENLKEAFYEFSNLLTMEQLTKAKNEIVEFGDEKLDEIEDYIKKRPLLIVGCALGMGFLIGTLLRSSK